MYQQYQSSESLIKTSRTSNIDGFENHHIKSVADRYNRFKFSRAAFKPSHILSINKRDVSMRKHKNDQTPLSPLIETGSEEIVIVHGIPRSESISKDPEVGPLHEHIYG